MKNHNQVILCDLGGVLIDLDWKASATKLFGPDFSLEQLREKWSSLSAIKEFESGKCSFADFHQTFCRETGKNFDISEFSREFCTIIGPPKPDCKKILSELKNLGRLAMLSNTNNIHIDKLRDETDILNEFDHLFFSYEMGMIKPSREIFHTVCQNLGVEPEKVLFFDDSSLNVKSALDCGLQSFQVNSPAEILKIVKTVLK